jgi:hypothetical protein
MFTAPHWGGPLRKNKAFFFGSYQGTRDANGATGGSIYKGVLIAPGLTDDRSADTLMNTFKVGSVDPIALKLLNLKLPNGKFLIPTPQTSDGLVTGSALSTYQEEQFNTNLDQRKPGIFTRSGALHPKRGIFHRFLRKLVMPQGTVAESCLVHGKRK